MLSLPKDEMSKKMENGQAQFESACVTSSFNPINKANCSLSYFSRLNLYMLHTTNAKLLSMILV